MAIMIAHTEQGYVQGQRAGNNRISVFRGIPFAQPPVGELRWRAPLPPESWMGVRKAWNYSPIPIQPVRPKGSMYQRLYFPVNLEQSEDCLYLNIWTPAESTDEKLPVAVWIFGGGYTTGYANKIEFDGEAFAKRGCVYVSLNYRVGIMGFLAHRELSAETPVGVSGNYGLLDQIAALEWVRQNIASFGGDPENVTIFGQSAGAMSCMHLCSTHATDGLFHRVIAESGGGLFIENYRTIKTLEEAERTGEDTLKAIGLNHIQEARRLSAQDFMRRYLTLQGFKMMDFSPIIDGAIFPESPVQSIFLDKLKKIDYLLGSTENEGYGFNEGKVYNPIAFKENAKMLFLDEVDDYLSAVGYDPNGKVMPVDNFGDGMFAGPTAWNELELKRGGNTAYQYYFTKTLPGVESGAFHSAEHAYIFQTLNRFDLPYKGSDFELSNMMCDYWCNFIKTGDPNGDGLPVWNKYGSSSKKIMELGEHTGMIPLPDRPGARFTVEYLIREWQKYESGQKS